MKHWLWLVAPIAALAACAGDHAAATPDAATTPAVAADAAFNAADVRFVERMVLSDRQAVTMADMALAHSASTPVIELAKAIKAKAGPTLATLQTWLTTHRDAKTLSGLGPPDGMLPEYELDELAQADAIRFDRQFLDMMLRHHQGATAMAEAVLRAGKDAVIHDLAVRLIDRHRADVVAMQALLAQGDPDSA